MPEALDLLSFGVGLFEAGQRQRQGDRLFRQVLEGDRQLAPLPQLSSNLGVNVIDPFAEHHPG